MILSGKMVIPDFVDLLQSRHTRKTQIRLFNPFGAG